MENIETSEDGLTLTEATAFVIWRADEVRRIITMCGSPPHLADGYQLAMWLLTDPGGARLSHAEAMIELEAL